MLKTRVLRSSNLPFDIGDLTCTQLIGRGGFAEVFLAENRKTGVNYVAKVITFDAAENDSKKTTFETEIATLKQLSHPNIIRLYNYMISNNQLIMILEYCPNGTLQNELYNTTGLPLGKFVTFATEIIDAIAYAHSKKIAHRDIKLGNILLDKYNRAKLADFGLSIQLLRDPVFNGFSGSSTYLAPEVFQKKPHNPFLADIWSLGVLFVIMTTGSSPWRCDSLGTMKQLASTASFHMSKRVPDVLYNLIKRMIVVDPESRITIQVLKNHPLFRNSIPRVISISTSRITIPRIKPPSDYGDESNHVFLSGASFLMHAITQTKKPTNRYHRLSADDFHHHNSIAELKYI